MCHLKVLQRREVALIVGVTRYAIIPHYGAPRFVEEIPIGQEAVFPWPGGLIFCLIGRAGNAPPKRRRIDGAERRLRKGGPEV